MEKEEKTVLLTRLKARREELDNLIGLIEALSTPPEPEFKSGAALCREIKPPGKPVPPANRKNTQWAKDEDFKLRNLYLLGEDYGAIGRQMGRTRQAITTRIWTLKKRGFIK